MDPRMILPPRSALYLPASNARAIEKARGLAADMIILDLEDAVKPGLKDEAREAAVEAVAQGFGDRPVAIRINGPESGWYEPDIVAVRGSRAQLVVIPKAESAEIVNQVSELTGKPVLAMIETPRSILNVAAIAAADDIAGLIAGTNDLANDLRLPSSLDRSGLTMALQSIVLGARAAGIWALDGVFNKLDDQVGLDAQCAEGRRFGFDGKTLIHPNQIDAANRHWSPSATEIEDARALVEAASGGAERFRDRMIETMHVEMAKRVLTRGG